MSEKNIEWDVKPKTHKTKYYPGMSQSELSGAFVSGAWIAVAGHLLYSLPKVCKIVVATAVIHNMCISDKIPLPEGCDIRDSGRIRSQDYTDNLNDGENVRLQCPVWCIKPS